MERIARVSRVIWLAVVLALLSAVTVGFSTSLQHRAASEVPEGTGEVGLLATLVRRPIWWLGQGLGFVALLFHTAALAFGPIALVQPIAIMGMVFGPPIRAAMSRQLLPREEGFAVVVTFAGLVAFLLATSPTHSEVVAGPGVYSVIAACAAASVVLLLASYRVPESGLRGSLMGSAAGLLFGSVAVCLKIVTHALRDEGLVGALASPATWACVALGIAGLGINQLSYRAARLSATMPALNIVNVAVAVAIGYLVFDEAPRLTPVAVAVEVAAFLAIGWGLVTLARYEEEHDAELTPPEGSRV